MSSAPWQKPFRGMQINKAHPLAKGLVGCWVMNEATGDKVFDLSGNSNHGTNNGAGWVSDGLDLNGTSDYITALDNNSLDLVNAWTISIFVNFDLANTWERLLYKGASTTGNYYIQRRDSNAFNIGFYRSGWKELTTTQTVSNGGWHHIVGTWDGTTIRGYIDSIIDSATATPGTTPLANSGLLYMGYDGDGSAATDFLNGKLKTVQIYNRALSAEEVAWLNREPYAMFEQPISPASLYYEAIAATDVYLTLLQTAGITESGQAAAQGPVTLSSSLAAVDGGAANALAPVTLSDILSLTVGAEAIAESTITIAEILSTLQAATTPGLGLIDTPNKRRSVMGIPAIPNNQIYGRDKQQIAGLYRGSFEYVPGALSLNEILALTTAGQVAASSDVTLSKVLTILQNYLTEFDGSITLNETLTTLFASEATAQAFITFAKTLTVAQSTAEVTQVYLTLAYNLAVQTQASSIAAVALSMAINAGISATVTIEVTDDLALSQALAVAQSATAETSAQLSLNNILAVSVVAEALASAGISLNMVEVVITDSGPTFEVTTPSGRTITIAAEVRIATVADEDRTVVIN